MKIETLRKRAEAKGWEVTKDTGERLLLRRDGTTVTIARYPPGDRKLVGRDFMWATVSAGLDTVTGTARVMGLGDE